MAGFGLIDESVNVGEKIRRARRAAGLSQLRLAQRMGISAPNITSWEKGHRQPKLQTLRRLAKAIGCPLNALIHL